MATTDIKAEVAGTIFEIEAFEGARLAEGDTILVIESMKMEIAVTAPVAGTLRRLLVAEKDTVARGQLLAQIAS